MAPDEGNAWFLHGQGGRRFGPLSEDEMRGYFRAGMVKSVDRISAPGFSEPQPAGAVAAMLGETVPPGPPPPALAPEAPAAAAPVATGIPASSLSPGSLAGAAAGRPGDAELDERAKRAIAAMNIDFATMAAADSSKRKSSGWLLPAIAGIGLIAMLFFALSMLRNMSQGGGRALPPGGLPPGASPEAGAEDTVAEPPISPAGVEISAPRQLEVPAPAASGDAEASFRRADQLVQGKDWEGLRVHATAWTQAQPERNDARQFLGLAHSRLGNTDQAVDAFKRVLAAEPGNNNAHALLAEVYLVAQRWPEAAEAYKHLVGVMPQDARLWNNYGVSLGQINQGPQAAAALETAVRLDPAFKQAWTNLGQTYQNMGDGGRAAAAFAQASALR